MYVLKNYLRIVEYMDGQIYRYNIIMYNTIRYYYDTVKVMNFIPKVPSTNKYTVRINDQPRANIMQPATSPTAEFSETYSNYCGAYLGYLYNPRATPSFATIANAAIPSPSVA